MPAAGTNIWRREGPEKLCGTARYIDDYTFPGCLFGVTYRSSIARGLIKKIVFDPKFSWDEFTVVTAKDIPGVNRVVLIENDQPLLADVKITHPLEPIVLVAHSQRHKAYEALSHIRAEFMEQPPVLTIEESLALKETLYSMDNAFKKLLIERGSVESAMAQADFVVEGEYRVPHQEQAYIENNGIAAYFEKDGSLVVMGSMQCPYYVHKALKAVFKLSDHRIRVIQTTTGGGFGGKEDYPSMIAGHAGLLALKSGRPVKIIYDRHEDMAATTKRHPAIVRHKTGVAKDGRLLAQDIEVIMDGGAYATLSPVVLSRGALHATGPYECPNVRVRSVCMITNTPPNGAFRGFGAPQTLFAAELHMEKIASVIGMDSVELRRKNVFKLGAVTATGQILRESVGAREVLERTLKRSRYAQKRKEYSRWNKNKRHSTWRGMGIALVHHGAGFTGSGEVYLASRAGVSLTQEGTVKVLTASTEIGQGTNTIFAQIVSHALDLPQTMVEIEMPDTSLVPDSGPTVASRTCMVVGGLIERAALEMKEAVVRAAGEFPRTKKGLARAAAKILNGAPFRAFIVQYKKPDEIEWNDHAYSGDAYGVFSYGCVAVDLEVDRATYEVRLRRLTTVQDIGRAINSKLAEGQMIGGITQALGYALWENPVYQNGFMQNSQLTNYIIPTAMDTPPMDVEIVEKPYSHGPWGAKGVGELPMDIPGPAVAAAIGHATGLWMTELPILPEKICRKINAN
ncbi:MAG: xanthine dehydrogenase family protein [Elusimicrobia bacterium]|nr:xanthine dehydrogenase family protein [Elusimicrobiota bacterium]